MKNLFKLIAMSAAALVAFSACQQEIETPEDNLVSEVAPLNIRVKAIADDLLDPIGTRTYIGTYNDVPNTIIWGTGEYMKIGVSDGETTVWGKSSDNSADAWNGENSACFEFSITPASTVDTYTYYGLYPFSSAVQSSNNNKPDAYNVSLPTTQNATASSYDPKAYIMVARPETFNARQTEWTASYRRATALNKVTLKNLPEAIKRVTFIAPSGQYLAGARHINLTTGESGEIYNGGGRTESIDVKFATPLSGSNIDVWFTSWDATIAEGESLTVIAYSNAHTFTRTITARSGGITFKEGYLNTLGINMSTAEQGNNTELDEGNYLVLAKNGDTYYALKAEKEEGKERLLSVDYTGSLDSYLGDADLIWTVSKSGDSYIFENDGKYLGYKGSSNESYWLTAGENWTTTNYLLDVTAQQENAGQFYVTLHSNSSRYLSRNNDDAFFAFYANTSQKADIIFVPATVDSRTSVTLSFAESAISKTTANYNEFTGQAATATPNESAITSNISYELTGDNIGSITSGHTVSLNGNTGTATVTASFDGDPTYRPATASYTITVTDASGPEWVETAIGDLTSTDVFVIVGNTGPYAMTNDNGTSAAPAVSSVTVSGTKLTGTIADNIKWNISGNATDGYTFYPNGDNTTWLYCTSTNNGVRVGNNDNKLFTLNANGYLVNKATSRVISIYNKQDWRCYSNTSNNPQVVKFYKYVTAPDTREDAGLQWSATSASATITSSGVSFTAPTLTTGNAHDITYQSTNTNVATISSAGVVNIIAGGTTTIQAIFAGDSNFKPATAEYTLTVTSYDFETIAELNTLTTDLGNGNSESFSGRLTNAVVSYVPNADNAIIKDETGSILVFKTAHGLLQGQSYSGELTVTTKLYYTTVEITAIDASFSGSQAVVLPATMTLSQLNGYFSTYQNAYVKVEGLTISNRDGKTINVSDGTNSYVVYDNQGSSTAAIGDVITAIGTVADHNGTNQIKVWDSNSITITASAPKAITFNQPTSGGSFTVTAGGSTITSGTTVASGTTVTLTATAQTGYTFNGWTVTGATVADASASTTTFTMGNSEVSINASFSNGSKKTYTLTITASDFNTTSYAANNNEKTSQAVASDNSTLEVKWTSNQIMKQGSNMQWQKNNGYLYNSTDLGTIKSVTVNSTAGTFTTNYGTTEHPTSGTTVGNGFFTTKVGGATGTTSSVVIVFEK